MYVDTLLFFNIVSSTVKAVTFYLILRQKLYYHHKYHKPPL